MTQARKEIEPAIWTVLLQSIHDGRCVPFLGAAANVGGGGTRIPTGVELALEIVGAMTGVAVKSLDELVTVDPKHAVLKDRKELVRLDLSELARISLYYRNQLGAKDFLDDVRGRIIHKASAPSPLLQVLARLPFKLIVTTNYDGMMEAALGKRPYLRVAQPIHGFEEKRGADLDEKLTNFEGVRLYKLHGEFPEVRVLAAHEDLPAHEGEASPIIITEEDYIQFLVVLREPLRGVPKWVQSQIRQSRFLFLGYGLEDWDFRTLFEGLIAPIPKFLKPTSYAIQWDPPQFWVDYWEARGVWIYGMDISKFAEQLDRKYRDKFGEPLPAYD
jgi:hypothetical protein